MDVLSKKLDKDRFTVREWGKRSAIVIDLQAGPIGKMESQIKVTSAMLKSLGPNLTCSIHDLPADMQDDVLSAVRHAPLFEDGFDFAQATVGIDASTCFTIEGQGHPPIVDNIQPNNDATLQRNRDLKKHPMLFRQPRDDSEAKMVRDWGTKWAVDQTDMKLHLFGIAEIYFAEGADQLAKAIDDVWNELKAKQSDLAQKILAKIYPGGSKLPAGKVTPNDLPPGFRSQLASQFSNSWRGYGFGSQLEAENFFQNCSGITISTQYAIAFCENPGDPTRHNPGSFGSIGLGGMPGGISP